MSLELKVKIVNKKLKVKNREYGPMAELVYARDFDLDVKRECLKGNL